ncbi:hypothetical protein CXG81DRAFT_28637 [Caulochytrium protostelioides]|uniref:60S ribosomal protein L31-like protein n=1 Tax=Caulochytrium protostelioides TaxID=1555241 RepID=A0A4P9X0U2_9FUNG|nr:60S ribosomal protein L31-like protein [Caulochytrium protostelioides]RKO98545.1 hypothetical protein CXG81DRAFT_28637 [Caulochytrium protostelioides]|eukprot:RKO98545.1 hypothetical protein CXG81DRAFT_28637 [Caulochytrium protostelioides]
MAIEKKSALTQVNAREFSVHLHKHLYNVGFKKRAPRSIKYIKEIATKQMKCKDVRIDVGLNKALWNNGIRNVPRRIRVRFTRKRADGDNAAKSYILVTHVPVTSFKGLQTTNVDDEE